MKRIPVLVTAVLAAATAAACSSASSGSSSSGSSTSGSSSGGSSSGGSGSSSGSGSGDTVQAGSFQAGTAACKGSGELIGFSAPFADPNFQLWNDVISADAKRAGLTSTMTTGDRTDPGKQLADVQTMLQRGVKAIIVAPLDPNALQPAVDRAKAQGVQMVVTDTAVGGPYATNIATSARQAGSDGADYLKKKVADGKVAAILGPTVSEAVKVRNEGFLTEAKKIGLNVVDQQTNGKLDAETARAITDSWRQKYGKDLAAIWSFNDTSAVAATSALQGSFKPVVIGMNAQPDAVAAVQQGRLSATFDLQPITIAHAMFWAADLARCGKKLPATVTVGDTLVDSSTVGNWVPWDQLKARSATLQLKQDGDGYTIGVS